MISIRLLAAVAALAATAPALAQELPATADKVLWCASAFYWLAGSAEDSGDAVEAEMYDRWSTQLLEQAGATLTAAGFVPERIEALITAYDERALVELTAADAPYDVATCPNLLAGRQ